MIRIKGARQADIASPIDVGRFRPLVPFEKRRHAALITGDAVRVAADAEDLALAAGYPVEFMDYLSAPYEQMPEILNRYQAVVVAPRMLHAFGRLAAEALACGCRVITNERVGAMSYDDPVGAAKESTDRFWEWVLDRPARPNRRRLIPGAGMDVRMPLGVIRAGVRLLRIYIGSRARLCRLETFPVHQERLIYHCPLNGRKRANLACQAVNKRFLKAVEISRPHILHVGVTTRCNLRCPACPTGTASLGRAGEDLDYGLFCRTVDSLRGSLLFMLFWDWGEPFLHPQLPEMIRYAGQSGIRTVISTNGNVVYSPAKLEELVRAKPSVVIVCVDGADQETYATYRTGGRQETVLQTLRSLSETRERLGQSEPMIEMRSLATKGTERQLPQLLELARNNGADLFSVKNLRPYNYRGDSIDGELVPENNEFARYRYKDDERNPASRESFVSTGKLTCAKPLYAPTLNSDGVLAFCSYAQNENEFFGNLSAGGFSKVWKGAPARRCRQEFLRRGGTASCRTCYFRSTPSPTILHQVVLRPLPDGVEAEAPEKPEDFPARFSDRS
jgi:MoaA/NifB/PqqE/SkfB family radical SAM enzyme